MSVLASTPPGYRPFDEAGLRQYLAALPVAADRLGGSAERWSIREVSDGNLNAVFLVDGPAGSVCVKQSLPHVRVLESWKMPVERTFFESTYFRLIGPFVGWLIPAVYHYDAEQFAIVMEALRPHVVLRNGLIAGQAYPQVAQDVGRYVAAASFATSDLGQRFESKFDGVAIFARNHALLRITVDLVFTDPYRESERNRHTSPQLDDVAAAFRSDAPLKIAASRWGHRFLSNAQALIHGDLHTGSVMVTARDSRVIDPEFACYGPIGFDLGAFVGNLLISAFSQPGHATAAEPRNDRTAWILAQIPIFWNAFRAHFLALWSADPRGDGYPAALFEDSVGQEALARERARFVDGLYADMLGFAAVKMIRRILGFAHVADFLTIADPERRAACERATLELARTMLLAPEHFPDVDALVAAAGSRAGALAARLR